MATQEGKLSLTKKAPPPPNLPIYQQMDPASLSFIGRTNYEAPLESKKYIFGIKRTDRRRHVYVIGKAGSGKSKLLELLVRQDIAFGYGLCFIDADGDAIEGILDFVPEGRMNDVVIIDPTDVDWPIAFNPLKDVPQELRHQLAQGLVECFEKRFGASWNSRLEHVLRFSVLALLDYPDATLRGIISLLTDISYRETVIPYIKDDMVQRFFSVEFENWERRFDADAIIPLVNALGHFFSLPLFRTVFSRTENIISFEKMLEERKIILINLAKPRIGEENASLLGTLCLIKLRQACAARVASKNQKDFYLYIDEFHSLVTPSFVHLLSEGSKYGISLTLAHQYTAQLEPAILGTILGNTATIITFRVGGEDAARLEAEMNPSFKAKDMINLATREFYIKETIDGETSDPFSADTLGILAPTHGSYRDRILELSRSRYALPAEETGSNTPRQEREKTEDVLSDTMEGDS